VSGIFEMGNLLGNVSPERPYHEFLRSTSMSAGLYVLAAGGTDRQSPHKEDEVYYVVRGKAKMRIGTQETEVTAGRMIFVEAEAEHRFFDIEQELVLLVVFAPAESSW
jgi:mannose-6-phosphate isomerase-like protein (cupin superfamily)